MNIKWKPILISLGIPLAAGGLAALLSGGMDNYEYLNQPPLAPPGWVFPVVWSILYLLMGYASYRVVFSEGSFPQIRRALTLYGVQLFLNFLWPILFFRFQWFLAAFFLLLLLWAAILATIHAFSKVDEKAGNLLIPYLLWVSFAGYLNLGVALLN